MIPSRNRQKDLLKTLGKLNQLDPAPGEVLVHLDGRLAPDLVSLPTNLRFELRISRSERPIGSIAARDAMIRKARGEFILSLDDDSYPEDKAFLSKAEAAWKGKCRTAVLWFPQRSDEFPASLAQESFGREVLTGSYSSSGAILRRAVYGHLAGYAVDFFHAYEEPDYALQCLAAGWEVRFYPHLTIRHTYSSSNRNERRTHHLHARNELWSVWRRCPLFALPFMTLRRIAGQFAYASRRGLFWVLLEPLWWWRAALGLLPCWRGRRAVSWSSYREWLRLLRQPSPVL